MNNDLCKEISPEGLFQDLIEIRTDLKKIQIVTVDVNYQDPGNAPKALIEVSGFDNLMFELCDKNEMQPDFDLYAHPVIGFDMTDLGEIANIRYHYFLQTDRYSISFDSNHLPTITKIQDR